MAKIKFGMFMTDARGKVGGQVFSKNRSGAYVRTKVTPSNPRTSAQSAVRQALASISASWSGLTEGQIAGWNGAVNDWKGTNIFGDSTSPSGKTLFVKLNLNLENTAQPQVLSAPAKVDMPSIGLVIPRMDLTVEEIFMQNLQQPTGYKTVVSATPPLSKGTSFYKGKFRQIFVSDSAAPNPTGLYQAYVARFGEPVLGANIAFSVKFVASNGQAGVPVVSQAIVF